MKHLLVLLIVIIAIYVIWNLTPSGERSRAMRLITRHAFRLGALITVALCVLAVAYYIPSSNLL